MIARRLSLEQILTQCAELGVRFVTDGSGILFFTCELVFDIETYMSDELLGGIIRSQAELLKSAQLFTAEQLEQALAERFDPRQPAPPGQFKQEAWLRLNCGELRQHCADAGFYFAKDEANTLLICSDYLSGQDIDAALSDRMFGAIVRNRAALLKVATPLRRQQHHFHHFQTEELTP